MNLEGITQKEWEDLYIQLYAYADSLLKSLEWFRVAVKDSYLKGKEPKDYVMEAVVRYLEHPEKYDSGKRTLLGYLKKHIIRSLASNDARSEENKVSDDSLASRIKQDGISDGDVAEDFIPYVEVMYDGELDYRKIVDEVKEEIGKNERVLVIFEKICCDGMRRKEVIQDEGWSDEIFDNGMKRLNRIRIKVAKKYSLKGK